MGHKTPTQSKRKRTGKKGLKGHGPEHVYNTLGYIYNTVRTVCMFKQSWKVPNFVGIPKMSTNFGIELPVFMFDAKMEFAQFQNLAAQSGNS